MPEHCMPIRKEVRAFLAASEQLYKILSEGQSLNVHEAVTIRCCLDELLTEGERALHQFGP